MQQKGGWVRRKTQVVVESINNLLTVIAVI